MAKFYAVFDPTYDNVTLNTTYHEKRFIGMSTGGDVALAAAGAALRNGLIASRSLLSTALLVSVDPVNQGTSTTRGVVIPYDAITTTADSMSWSNVYTSSAPGLRFESDPSVRVTSSISTTTNVVGPASPTDAGGVRKDYYLSASNAINDVIKNKIQSSSNSLSNSGPYERLGNYPSRTLNSLYHDYDLNYFAWNDFTPGTPQTFTVADPSNGSGVFYYTNPFTYTFSWNSTYQYKSDVSAIPTISALFKSSSGTTLQTLGETTLSAGVTQYAWSITADPAQTLQTVDVVIDATATFKEQVFSGGAGTSIGAAATLSNSNPITLIRLYSISTVYKGDGFLSGTTLCSAFVNSPVTLYTNNQTITVLNNSYLYTNTDTNSTPGTPNGGFGHWKNNISSEVYGSTGGGLIDSVGYCVP